MDGSEGTSSSSPPPPAPPPYTPSPETLTLSTGSEQDEDLVMSEVHLGCPPNFSGPYISRFTFSLPPEVEPMGSKCFGEIENEAPSTHKAVSLDKDGDLVVTRRGMCSKDNYVVTIRHNITTSIPSVGLQVWRAELVLADFVLHKMVTSFEWNGIIAVELGAGTGLVGILLARVAKTVFLTDLGDGVLDNCVNNVQLNSKMLHPRASVLVRELDWKDSWPPKVVENVPLKKRHAWNTAELQELQEATLIVAADVIYSDDLTDAFFNTLERLVMHRPEKMVYLALEKRYNFTLDDLNVVANGYSRFRSYLRVDGVCKPLNRGRTVPCFVGKCINLARIPQYIMEYDRGNDVEIWEIKYEMQKT